MTQKKQKVGGGGRKIGRNRPKCERYRARGQREVNRARKLAKRLRGFRRR